jgi:hypothetical protein
MNLNLNDGSRPAAHHRTFSQAITVPIMNPRRALLAMLIAGGYSLPAAEAGCLDWLFCKSTPIPAPTAVGVAPMGSVTPLGPPVPVGPPVQFQGGVSQFPTQTAPYQAAMNPWATGQFNNPSVLSGMPVNPNAAQISGFRGVMPPPTTTMPAVAPTWWGSTAPQTSYNAAAAFQAPATVQPPTTTGNWSHPMQTTPLPPPEYQGGVFGKVWGNGYDTSVNNVPTTVFRPVQQIDPQTGQMVIVQQPCTTTTQQVQRTPYSTMQPAPVPTSPQTYAGEPSCGRETPNYYSPGAVAPPASYAPQTNTAPPTTFAPQSSTYPNGYGTGTIGSGVTQATALDAAAATNGYGTSTPNSLGVTLPPPPTGSYSAPATGSYTAPATGSYTAPATGSYSAPATGSYSAPATGGSSATGSGSNGYGFPSSSSTGSGTTGTGSTTTTPTDASKVEQPRLEAPPLSSNYNQGSAANQGSAWGTVNTPSKSVSAKYSDLPPIPASDDYQPPAWNGSGAGGGTSPSGQPSATPAPRISPPSWNDRTAMRIGEPNRVVNEPSPTVAPASWQQPYSTPQPVPVKRTTPRDDSGWVALPPTGR